MSSLIYDSRFFAALLRAAGRLVLWLGRWKVVGVPPDIDRYVAVVAPHTSNWDFPVFMALVGYWRLRVRFLGKHTLFAGPAGWFFNWLGGISVRRESKDAAAMIDSAVGLFQTQEPLILGLAPEGTRSSVTRWKTGFYRIAVAANVPIVLAFLDAGRREIGFGRVFYPTGDQEKDIADIRAFYAAKRGLKNCD